MNAMNMAGFNTGNATMGNMPMPNNGPNGAAGRMAEDTDDPSTEPKLNSFIYAYLYSKGQYDAARALRDSGALFDPPLGNTDVNGDANIDSKDGIDMDRPKDLPYPRDLLNDGQGGPFLLSWFSMFWDVFWAQRRDPKATANATLYVQHTQNQARLRQEQNNQAMFNRMNAMPNGGMDLNQQMMRFQGGMNPENLRQKVLQNQNGGRIPATPQQVAQMQRQQYMHQHQAALARGERDMEMNGQRPRTPSASDHAPSPSKRQRMDGVPFGAQQMMLNGRGPPGMPGQMMGGAAAVNANQLLEQNGINPGNLSDSQFASFQQQNPHVQQKSIQVYAQNLAKNQRQQSMSHAAGSTEDHGSPFLQPGMDMGVGEFYNGGNPAAMQMRGVAPGPNVPNGGAGGNHALQDYQMQLMLLEQQNKKRLLMARQEQDSSGRPNDGSGMPPGAFAPGMSPSGSRGGPSPGPNDRKGGTPKINQIGLPGSPMPDGSMRGSPAAMNFNQINPEMYAAQMNANGMRPPNSHPAGFPNGQFSQQQIEQMTRPQQAGARMQPNGWQGTPGGQPPMMGQPQQQQPPQMGTPQQRNEMPPPQAVPGAATNGRPGSPASTVQPSPQPASKANPKGKKEAKERKAPKKKNSQASISATATATTGAEENAPPTPTPATPVTPQHQASFAPKNEGQAQPNMMSGMTTNPPEPLAQAQADATTMQIGAFEGAEGDYNMGFSTDDNLLENFDFEQFLNNGEGDFDFNSTLDGIETGLPGA